MRLILFKKIVLTLVAAYAIHAASAVCAAQSFRVPGDAGRKWLDTGLDLKPGSLVQLAAKGEVDAGAGWGSYGPEGTQKFADVPGYPAETTFRYGLVARVTSSRTNPEDDLREQWAYGETREHCAAAGGHLWLTVNDNEPKDNKGEFAVDVSLAPCRLAPTGRERQSGGFRIALNGFTVNRQTADSDFDGKADEVYVVADIFVMYRSGEIIERRRVVSRVLGDPNGQSGRQPAGSAAPSLFDLEGGGLLTGDSFPSSTPWRRTREPYTDRVPLLLWEGGLGEGDRIVTIIPTLWEWDGDDHFLRYYNEKLDEYARRGLSSAAADFARNWRRQSDGITFETGIELERSDGNALTNIAAPFSRSYQGDRPIGMWTSTSDRTGFGYFYVIEHFRPWAMAFTYESASEVVRTSTAYSNGVGPSVSNKGAGIIEYRLHEPTASGSNLGGAYTLYFQIERLSGG